MSAQVIEFRGSTRPIAHFVRVDDAHRRLGDLYAAGRLPIRRAVFDASRIARQKEFVAALKRDGVEIVLDTEVAELAAKEKFQTHVKNAPWAALSEGKPLDPSFFDATLSQANIVKWIARFAVEHGIDTVLAPTHFLGDSNFSGWLNLDLSSCQLLRRALDDEGGRQIAIDYPVIHSHTALNKADQRGMISQRLSDLPIDNLWIRASGLGSEVKPQTTKQFLKTLYELQSLNKSIIVDYADGLAAHALIAFGGASGLAQGIGERGSFNASNWHNPQKERDPDKPFGRTVYHPIPGLGRRLSTKELTLLAGAKGGRKLVGCQNSCCRSGVRDMLADSRQHAAHQALAPVLTMSEIPDLRREDFFLEKPLRNAERVARNIKDLNPSAKEAEKLKIDLDSLKKRMNDHHKKLGKFSDALGLLHDERGAAGPRAIACSTRTGPSRSALDGRKK